MENKKLITAWQWFKVAVIPYTDSRWKLLWLIFNGTHDLTHSVKYRLRFSAVVIEEFSTAIMCASNHLLLSRYHLINEHRFVGFIRCIKPSEYQDNIKIKMKVMTCIVRRQFIEPWLSNVIDYPLRHSISYSIWTP